MTEWWFIEEKQLLHQWNQCRFLGGKNMKWIIRHHPNRCYWFIHFKCFHCASRLVRKSRLLRHFLLSQTSNLWMETFFSKAITLLCISVLVLSGDNKSRFKTVVLTRPSITENTLNYKKDWYLKEMIALTELDSFMIALQVKASFAKLF